MSWLITRGCLSALSLTHIFPDKWTGDIVPYEVTLCIKPKRPHCYIVAAAIDLLTITEYKRGLVSGTIRDKSQHISKPAYIPVMASPADIPKDTALQQPVAMSSAEPENTIELVGKILDTLPPKDGQVITEGFLNLKKLADDHKIAREQAETKLKEAENLVAEEKKKTKSSDINAAALKEYIDLIKKGIGEKRAGFIDENVMRGIESDDTTTKINALQRVVHVAAYAIQDAHVKSVFDSTDSTATQSAAKPSERLSTIFHVSEGALNANGKRPNMSAEDDIMSSSRKTPHMASADSSLSGEKLFAQCIQQAYTLTN